MKKYECYERKVNYYETDKMSVVHHSNYARYLEECRVDMLGYYGIPLEMFEELGYVIPVLELSCRFVQSVRFGDTIKIVPKLERVTNTRFYISYIIYNNDMTQIMHTAETSHCFLNSQYKPASLKREQPELFNKLLEISGLYE